MSIDHGGFDIFVAEEFLDGADVIAVLEQVGGEGVAEGVATDRFIGDASQDCSGTYGFLQATFSNMVTALNPRAWVRDNAFARKNILPGPFAIGIRVFIFERVGQVDCAESVFQVFLMNLFDAPEMFFKGEEQAFRQHGDAIFFAFAIPDGEALLFKINIFYTQTNTLANAQSATVKQFGHELLCARHGIDDTHNFVLVQDGRNTLGFAGSNGVDGFKRLVEDFFIEEDEGAEGLVLRGGSNFALGGEVGDEGFDFGIAHFIGVALVVEEDEAAAPVYVGFLCAKGVVLGLESLAHSVEKFFPPGGRCVFAGRWGVFF
jgi:hypothetical protein